MCSFTSKDSDTLFLITAAVARCRATTVAVVSAAAANPRHIVTAACARVCRVRGDKRRGGATPTPAAAPAVVAEPMAGPGSAATIKSSAHNGSEANLQGAYLFRDSAYVVRLE